MSRRTRSRTKGGALLGAGLAIAVLLSGPAAQGKEDQRVAVSFVGDADSPSERGAMLGLEEASRAASYFGFRFELAPGEPGALVIAATRETGALEQLAVPGRLVVNALDPRRGGCRDGLFHVAPSQAMRASAAAQWSAERGGEVPAVEAWHPSLVKFAARDLNKRYAERFGEPMRSESWAAWAAARSIGEAVLRVQSADPTSIADYFVGEFGLDGQKGTALRFRPNHQLRQPLYFVDATDTVVGEAPLAGRDLDSLGALACER